MDDWGDPWADDEERKPPSGQQAAGPSRSFSGVLTGFQDEAQWGDWATEEPVQELGALKPVEDSRTFAELSEIASPVDSTEPPPDHTSDATTPTSPVAQSHIWPNNDAFAPEDRHDTWLEDAE